MGYLFLSQKAGGVFGSEGNVKRASPNLLESNYPVLADPDIYDVLVPTGVNPTKTQPTAVTYNGDAISRLYLCGSHTDNMLYTEEYRFLRQGMLPIRHELVNGVATDTTKIGTRLVAGPGVSGNVIVYVTVYDDVHGRRSPLSRPSPTMAASNQAIEFNNMPDVDQLDESADFFEFWFSVDGAQPALADRRQIGASTYTIDTVALSLGEVFLTSFEKFPRCRWNVIYHDRQVMAGDDRHPDRLYFSDLTFPERYAGLFLRTRNGEPITALAIVRDVLLVFSPRSTYAVQGYTQDDLEMQIVEPQIGCINHFGIRNVHGHLIVPSHLGFYLSTGSSFFFLSEEHQQTWRDEYRLHETAYNSAAWAIDDPEENVYKFYVGEATFIHTGLPSIITGSPIVGRNWYWVLDYTPLIRELSTGGGFQPPRLSFDMRARVDCWANYLTLPGSSRGRVVTGSNDGFARVENESSNEDDDGDARSMVFYVRTKHYFWGDPMGGPEDGSRVDTAWLYVESENQQWQADVYMGDLDAYRRSRVDDTDTVEAKGDWSVTVPSSRENYTGNNPLTGTDIDDVDSEKLSLHYVQPDVSGRGMTFSMTVLQPNDPTWFRGLAGTRVPGPTARRPIFIDINPG